MDNWTEFFDQTSFMPHGHCYLWKPPLVLLHVASDFFIGAAYVAISLTLYALVKKIKLPFSPVFVAFGVFIGACGLTHFMEILTLWNPVYWVSGLVKFITAIASVATGVALFKIMPHIVSFAETAKLSEERKAKLESAHAELEVLYARVKEMDVLKTEFFANVSHELRTPIALILGPAEELRAKCDDKSSKSRLDVITRNAKMLLKHVNDLLDVAKLEAGLLHPHYVRTDLVKLFRFVVAHFETIMQSRGIFFSLHAPGEVIAEVDPEKLQRIFMNLLSNAVKFCPDGGRIRAHLKSEGEFFEFLIEDNGPGVPVEARDIIFERFRQADAGANRKFGGTGLGLAIVKDFTELHGGTVSLLNGDFSGARFLVKIPLVAAQAFVVREEAAGDADFLIPGVLGGAISELKFAENTNIGTTDFRVDVPTVLICEDNPDMNRFIADVLAKDFNVVSAMDGREGLNQVLARPPDMVVSDIMMPNFGGEPLIEALKQDEQTKHIPILLLSARADDALRVELLQKGANDYLVKPFTAEELLARVHNLVQTKVARDVLQAENRMKSANIVELAKETASRKREAELALDVAQAARFEAEKASLAKGMFLNMVSHELNTPVTAMMLGVQLLSKNDRETLTERQRKIVDGIHGSFGMLKRLVDSLLQYVRTGNERVALENANLCEITKQAIGEFLPMIHQKGLELVTDIEPDCSYVTDVNKYRIIFNNLLMNAIKFTQAGKIVVRLKRAGEGLELSVQDSGIGISEPDRERIFLPFERVEALEHKSIDGVGLGLALVRNLVQDLGGRIELESELHKGSKFIVRFASP
jgi:signal transduction histidine kinase